MCFMLWQFTSYLLYYTTFSDLVEAVHFPFCQMTLNIIYFVRFQNKNLSGILIK